MVERAYERDLLKQQSVCFCGVLVCLTSLTTNSNVADIFKTPGKLRGKTPRTARKRNVLGERAVSPPSILSPEGIH